MKLEAFHATQMIEDDVVGQVEQIAKEFGNSMM